MERNSIKCQHCGGNDFEVIVNRFIPQIITLECKCGSFTPIAFFDKQEKVYGINDKSLQELSDRTYYDVIEPKEAAEVTLNYLKNKEKDKINEKAE